MGSASGCYSFPFNFPIFPSPFSLSLPPCLSVAAVCRESDSRKMVLAPKWNLRHKHHRAGCPLAGAGCFALEKQIQTRNTLLALWTASNKATFTAFCFFFPWKKKKLTVFICLTGTLLFLKRKERNKTTKVLVCSRCSSIFLFWKKTLPHLNFLTFQIFWVSHLKVAVKDAQLPSG